MNLEITNLGNEFTHYQALSNLTDRVVEKLPAAELFKVASTNNGVGYYSDVLELVRYDVFDGNNSKWVDAESTEDNWKLMNYCLQYIGKLVVDEAYYHFGLTGQDIRVVSNLYGIQYTYDGKRRYAYLVVEVCHKGQYKPVAVLGNSIHPYTSENYTDHLNPFFIVHKGKTNYVDEYKSSNEGYIHLLSPWDYKTRDVLYRVGEHIVDILAELRKQ